MRLTAVILEGEGFRSLLHEKSKVQKTKLGMNVFAKKKKKKFASNYFDSAFYGVFYVSFYTYIQNSTLCKEK